MDIQILKQSIDLVSVVESAGVVVQKQGRHYVALCPFHPEKTPSFVIYPDNFHCFSCSAHGDSIAFVQMKYGLSFPDALKFLGIETGELTPEVKEQIQERKRQRREVEGFKAWEQAAFDELHLLISSARKVLTTIKTPSHLDRAGPLFHSLTFLEHCFDVLINGDELEKVRLYMDSVVTGEYREDRLWNDEFDYRKWLEKFQKNGEQTDVNKRIEVSFN